MRKTFAPVLFLAALGLSACGDTDLERGALGAAIGCAAGETLVGGRCVEGAILGGAAGVFVDDI